MKEKQLRTERNNYDMISSNNSHKIRALVYSFETISVSRCTVFLVFFLLISTGYSTTCFAQFPRPTDFNTGNNGAGGKTPLLQPDLNWEANLGTTTGPGSTWVDAVVCGNQAPGAWINSPYSNADWITYPFTCTSAPAIHSCAGLVDVFFRYRFTLPPTGPCGQSITEVGAYTLALQFYVDNAAYSIKLNGVTKYNSPAGDPYNYAGFTAGGVANMTINAGFIEGENVILVHSKSGPGAAGFLAQASTIADSDVDGVADVSDRCPCLTGSLVNNGCTTPNVAPVVTMNSNVLKFQGDPIVVDGSITVADLGNTTTLGYGNVSITGNYQLSQDVLSFTNDGSTMGNISASFNSGTGVLSLISQYSSATVSEWQAAFRAVVYNNTSLTPNISNRTISISVNDGLVSSTAVTKILSVSLNDAPIISTATVTLPGLVEDVLSADNQGILVSDLLSGTVTDENDDPIGIAVTSRDHENGTWQFLEGAIWWNFDRHTVASDEQALLLSANTRIRFLPATHYDGSSSFTYRAWDQTTGTDHNIASTAVNGEGTSFSTETGTASVSLSSENDAPTITSLIGVTAIAFDGANDHVSFSNPGISGDYTLEAWIFVNQNQTWSRVFDMGNGPGSNNVIVGFFGGSAQLFGEVYNGGSGGVITAPSSFPTGVWKHVASVNDGLGTGYLYIDGVLVSSGGQNVTQDIVRTLNYLAKSNWGQDAYFKGAMREVRIWDIARTQSQIAENMNVNVQGNENGLKVYYKADENEGLILTDASGHGIDGTIEQGAAWSTFGDPLTTLIVIEDTDRVIPGFGLVDPDAASNIVSLTVTSTNGKIKFLTNIPDGITGGEISNNSSYTVLINSTITKINKTLELNGFLYSPDLNYNGSGKVVMELSDNGSVGVGGVLSSTYSFDVSVTPVNELPEITSSPLLIADEDSDYSYTVTSVDSNDPSDVLTFSASVIPSWLTIDEQTGVLSGIPTNDFVGNNDVTVRVFDGTVYVEQTFVIAVKNTNDIPFVGGKQSFTLSENSEIGTVVGSVIGYDEDVETTLGMWMIGDGNIGNAFSIDPITGIITISNSTALDFETQSFFELVVTVSDGISSSEPRTVRINLEDVGEHPVITENQVFELNENGTDGFVVGTVNALDPDEGTTLMGWTIVSGNTNDAFSIDATTGVITVSNTASHDYESITTFILTLSVNDGDLTSPAQTVTINLANTNDNNPAITGNQTFSVDENKAVGSVVASPEVDDEDGITVYQNWTIIGGNTNDAFSINPVSGEITVNNSAALDYELVKNFTLTISVSDGANLSTVQTIGIDVNNLNDIKPVVASNVSLQIAENNENGFLVGTITAVDEDGETAYSNWSIVGGNTANTFSIDPLTGVISVANSATLDFETNPTYTLEITVTDGLNTSVIQTVVIHVTDLNEVPVIAENQSFELMENSPNGFELGVASVIDPDGTNTFVNWQIASGNSNNVFEINPVTGLITVKENAELDFEAQSSYTLMITVTDGNGVSSEVPVTINLIDAPENADGNPVIFTAFSPNGDGVNDTWNVPNLNAHPNCEMKVFNSDGIELFYNKGYTRKWDGTYQGKMMPLGTYYYLVRLNDSAGTVYKGHFMIIR